MTEVFYTKNSDGYSFIVDVVHTCMITDKMTVVRAGREYQLTFNASTAMYEGEVAGSAGYLV